VYIYVYKACAHALMERPLHQSFVGWHLKCKLEKSVGWLVKQGEAVAMLGYGLRLLVTGKACPLPVSSIWVMSAGGSSVTTIVHSVSCGWIKLCVRRAVDVWLLSVCEIEICCFGKV
jgi:hypothetical protein